MFDINPPIYVNVFLKFNHSCNWKCVIKTRTITFYRNFIRVYGMPLMEEKTERRI